MRAIGWQVHWIAPSLSSSYLFAGMEVWAPEGEVSDSNEQVDGTPISHPEAPAPMWRAAALAWAVPCVSNAVALGLAARPLGDWFELQAFNLAQHTAFAFLTYLSVKLWHKGRLTSRASAALALLVLSNLLGWMVLPDDVRNFSERYSDTAPPWLSQALLITLMASSVALGWIVGVKLAGRQPWRLALAVVGVAVIVVNHLVLPGDYRGVHLFLCLVAVATLSTILAYDPWARWLAAASRFLALNASRRTALIVLGAAGLAGLVIVSPAGGVQTALLRSQSAPVYGLLARMHGTPSANGTRLSGEWFVPRPEGYLPPAAPAESGPALFDAPIVLLLTVDALRADLITGQYDDELPTFARLRKESVFFDEARAPGTLTKVSVTSVFMGKYFSQQFWSKEDGGIVGVIADPTLRFPEYLRAGSIPTVNFTAIGWLRNGRGCVRGFTEEYRIKHKKKYVPGAPVMDAILERIAKVKHGPLFLHTHFSDAHDPYDLGKRTGTPFERYRSEVALVDHELERLLAALEAHNLADRTILIVQADHGEAFGEHGSQTHGTTLYDEVLRVPLMFKIPGIKARRVTTPVTTMDLAPTILEIFGRPIPASFMGQSLVPTLKGSSQNFTRPIAAENRLQQTLVLPNGLKVIHDTRTKSSELYDLKQDPGEIRDLSGNAELLEEPLATLHAFFEAHRYKAPGYQPPYIR